jgi:preprotein translocase subunit SecB
VAHKFTISYIRLTEAHFSINQQYEWEKEKQIALPFKIDINCKQALDKNIRVGVSVSSDSDKQPFRFTVAWEGLFDFEEMPSKEDLERIAHINCAAIIFAYIREFLADLTRRANVPPLNLPSFNFVAMYEERQRAASNVTPRRSRKKSKA